MSEPPLQRVKEIFTAALGLSPDKIARLLDSQCTGDAATRTAVEDLLRAHAEAGHFLDPAPTTHSTATANHFGVDVSRLLLGEAPGSIIDRYTLIERLGEGGFGVVFRAQQTQPVRRVVALKVVKLGMDTAQVIARFEAERQALALMDHPNIARVIDGGATASGRPYFVMELVDGVAVTRFCDEHRMDIRRRLELFVGICRAVQHAHQKGLIHRDLKPSNILVASVEGVPTPKVIDFGIAKAVATSLAAEPHVTDHRQLTGTPQYMSPEQAESDGQAADTRSDVYSLGVVLYELLTGTTPIDVDRLRGATLEQTRRVLRTSEARKPSDVALSLPPAGAEARDDTPHGLFRALRGDLDWIVLKALERERPRRYQSVADLGDDIKRHLSGLAILAGPRSKVYLVRKFVARHRAALAIAAIIVVSLVGGLTAASVGLVRAKVAQEQAGEKLFDALLAQAHAGTLSGRPGQRFEGLRVLGQAARVHSNLAIRNEAIACLALPDIKVAGIWDKPANPAGPLTFSPDLSIYATSERGVIQIRRSRDDAPVASFQSPARLTGNVFTFSPDAQFLVATVHSDGNELWVWDLKTSQCVFRCPIPPAQDHGVRFSPDGRLLAVASPGSAVTLYEAGSWTKAQSFSIGGLVERIAFDPTGARLAVTAPDRGVQIVDCHTGAVLQRLGGVQTFLALAWSGDGAMVTAAGTNTSDRRIFVWDVATGALQSTLLGHLSHPAEIEFTHDGSLIVSSGWDESLRVWDPFTGRQLVATEDLTSLRIAPDDRRLVTTVGAFARLWDLDVGRECRSVGGPLDDEQNASVDISPDGTLLAAAGQFGIRVWQLPSRRRVSWIETPGARSVFFSPDGKELMASSAEGVRRWPISRVLGRDGGPTTRMAKSPVKWGSRAIASMSADGQTLVFSSPDARMWRCDAQGGTPPVLLGKHDGLPWFVSVSPDGHFAASSRRSDSTFKVWDLTKHVLAVELKAGLEVPERGNVAFSPDGRTVVTSDPDAYQFWEVGTWRPGVRIPRKLPSIFGYAAFSPDGKILAGIGPSQNIVLYDARSGAEIATLRNPQPHEIECFTFSRDGRLLAVGNNDPSVTLWDLALVRRELAGMGLDW